MLKKFRFLYPPLILFLVSFLLDSFVTHIGLSLGFKEGDSVVLWLWSIFGYESLLLRIIYVSIIILVSYFLANLVNSKIGLWFLYSFGAGHFLGFLSWIYPTVLKLVTLGLYNFIPEVSFYILVVFAIFYGYIFTLLQYKYFPK